MPHLYQLEDVQMERPSMVTIGVFDGVHRGHQQPVGQLVAEAHAAGYLAVVITFHPHPDVVLKKITGRYYLTSPEQRADLLLNMGVDAVITHPFNDEVRQMRAADFVDRLLHHLKMTSLWVGADFALGYKREGNVAFLQEQGVQKGFTVQVVELLEHPDAQHRISSTGIREALAAGELDKANDWLGRAYAVAGVVVDGQKRGRTIGFPTANIHVGVEQVIPGNGVYAGWATIDTEKFMAVTNIGVRPTFSGQDITVEAHLLDFDRDIYGKTVNLTFEKRLRPEQKFNGIQELIAQIQQDVQTGREFLLNQR